MRLYYFPVAPNPTKVLAYLREKSIDLEMVLVSLSEGAQKSSEHLARNPRGTLPVLELDDGSFLTESLPIIEYLEELFPSPSMIGTTATQRATTRELERLADTRVLGAIGRIVHSTNSPLGRPPAPEIAEAERARLPEIFAFFDQQIGEGPFVLGDQPSIVDCTLLGGLYFGEFFGVEVPPAYTNLNNWYATYKERSSSVLI